MIFSFQTLSTRKTNQSILGTSQALEAAKSLEEVTAAHQDFMASVQRQCLLAPDRTWKLIEGVVVQILNQVLYFAELQQKLQKPVSRLLILLSEAQV